MCNSKLTVSRKKSWFFGRSSSKLTIASDLSTLGPELRAIVVSTFVRELFPFAEKIASRSFINNICGRNYSSFLQSRRPSVRPGEEELWYLKGQLLELSDSADHGLSFDQVSKDHKLKKPLQFILEQTTTFDSFPDSETISYSSRKISQGGGNLFSQLVPSQVAGLCPLFIKEARLGIEFYESRFIGSRFGMAPQIAGHFYWEYLGDSIIVDICDENIDNIGTLPLAKHDLWRALNRSYTAASIIENLADKVQQCLDAQKSKKVECALH